MMARKLPESTLSQVECELVDEHVHPSSIIEEFYWQRRMDCLIETGSEHNPDPDPDPDNADGGLLAFGMEMNLSTEQNAKDLLENVEHALDRMKKGRNGICEVSGKPVPVARLEALPYATARIMYADQV